VLLPNALLYTIMHKAALSIIIYNISSKHFTSIDLDGSHFLLKMTDNIDELTVHAAASPRGGPPRSGPPTFFLDELCDS